MVAKSRKCVQQFKNSINDKTYSTVAALDNKYRYTTLTKQRTR